VAIDILRRDHRPIARDLVPVSLLPVDSASGGPASGDSLRVSTTGRVAGTSMPCPDPVIAPTPDLVLVGGVPGAGKTTAIAAATDDLPDVHAVDPEHLTWWLRRHLPGGMPYRSYRWLVHLLHTVRVLVRLLDGPRAGLRLVVHDPGTRVGRRRLFLALAHLAGWRTVLLYVDVDRADARDGQVRRGRLVRSFDQHWASWQRLRPALDGATDRSVDPVVIVNRADAADVLRSLCL
jgi:hypothetical protein